MLKYVLSPNLVILFNLFQILDAKLLLLLLYGHLGDPALPHCKLNLIEMLWGYAKYHTYFMLSDCLTYSLSSISCSGHCNLSDGKFITAKVLMPHTESGLVWQCCRSSVQSGSYAKYANIGLNVPKCVWQVQFGFELGLNTEPVTK
jgi:hypothetical protein